MTRLLILIAISWAAVAPLPLRRTTARDTTARPMPHASMPSGDCWLTVLQLQRKARSMTTGAAPSVDCDVLKLSSYDPARASSQPSSPDQDAGAIDGTNDPRPRCATRCPAPEMVS